MRWQGEHWLPKAIARNLGVAKFGENLMTACIAAGIEVVHVEVLWQDDALRYRVSGRVAPWLKRENWGKPPQSV